MLAAEPRRSRGNCAVSSLKGGSVVTSRLLLDSCSLNFEFRSLVLLPRDVPSSADCQSSTLFL